MSYRMVCFSLNKIKYIPHRCIHFTSLYNQRKEKFFITTPIFYVNAAPHIGHVYSAVIADAIHRAQKLLGKDSLFSTGTDEHGLKIQQAAEKENVETNIFCDNISKKFKDVLAKSHVDYTDFVRTTESRHIEAVQSFWKRIEIRGQIYKSVYSGWYSTSDEAFYSSSQVTEVTDETGRTNKVSIETSQPVEWMEEENYMFALSKQSEDLLYWLKDDVIRPQQFADTVKLWIDEGLSDLSISRKQSRVSWGIPVPNDSSQTIYVWLDALVNYLTASGFPNSNFLWPADCHVIGKDILRFHALYWPAFLMAAGLDPPRSIFCHSHWLVDNVKMSKSRGNVVDPLPLIEKYTTDGLRYFLLKYGVAHSDGNYSDEKIFRLLNAELADTLGNLLSRCAAKAINKENLFPVLYPESVNQDAHNLITSVTNMSDEVITHFLEGNFYSGIDMIMDNIREANRFVQVNKPWELVKCDNRKEELSTVIHIALETLRVCSILLQPVVPTISDAILTKLNVPMNERYWEDFIPFPSYYGLDCRFEGKKLSVDKAIVFQRLENKN